MPAMSSASTPSTSRSPTKSKKERTRERRAREAHARAAATHRAPGDELRRGEGETPRGRRRSLPRAHPGDGAGRRHTARHRAARAKRWNGVPPQDCARRSRRSAALDAGATRINAVTRKDAPHLTESDNAPKAAAYSDATRAATRRSDVDTERRIVGVILVHGVSAGVREHVGVAEPFVDAVVHMPVDPQRWLVLANDSL